MRTRSGRNSWKLTKQEPTQEQIDEGSQYLLNVGRPELPQVVAEIWCNMHDVQPTGLTELVMAVTRATFYYIESWDDPDHFTDVVLDKRLTTLRNALAALRAHPDGPGILGEG